jgi:glyoxylase-like metal-dependent hydrolase (beta-lactamase superfamily II)
MLKINSFDLNFQNRQHCIYSHLLKADEHYYLIDPGPHLGTPKLLEQLDQQFHLKATDINAVFLTHIHLDHAGAAGWWAAQGACIYAHPRAKRHLLDPSRLLLGASQVYGKNAAEIWGEVLPIPSEKLYILEDQESVTLSKNHTLKAHSMLGHAKHHHVYEVDKELFVGDMAGARWPSSQWISPTTAPSDFNPDHYLNSLNLIEALQPQHLHLTHGGCFADVHYHLNEYRKILQDLKNWTQQMSNRELPSQQWIIEFQNKEQQRLFQHRQSNPTSPTWEEAEQFNPSHLSAAGIFWHAHFDTLTD